MRRTGWMPIVGTPIVGMPIVGMLIVGMLLTACSGTSTDPSAESGAASTTATSTTATSSSGASGGEGAGAGSDGPNGQYAIGAVPGPDELPLPGLLDPSDEQVPDDPSVRTGALDNGLRYYVRHNDNPGAKAELRLAIDAGSVDEFGPSTGTAHFLEHMLFNGTERFPENELIDVLRSFGAAFGADVNARTGYDSTVYQLTVPNADETVELGLTVLSEWLSHATLDPEQVVGERGVVLDEWRVRTQTTAGRRFEKSERMFLAGTAYDGRSPIGTERSISAMEAAELRAYYDRWYRPDNAAVVVVGDIDVDEIEADLRRLFGAASARGDAAAEVEATFPIDLEPDAFVHADRDQTTVDVEVTFPLPAVPQTGTAAARATLLDLLAVDALLRRLDQDATAGRAPFDSIAMGTNSFVRALDAPGLYAFTDGDRVGDTLVALLDEFERARRFGFSDAETEVVVESLRSFFRTRYEGRDSTQDRDYADTYVDDFLEASGYPSIEDEFAAVTGILDGITPEALTLRYRTRLANTAPHVIVSAPEAQAERMPTVDEILAAVAEAPERELFPRDERRRLPDTLMARPAPVEPVASNDVVPQGNELFDPLRLDFGNGVAVILNSNDIVEGQVFVQGASRGGLSLVADDDVVDGLYAADVVRTSGVGDFDASEVDEILAGADVSLDAWLEPYSERFAGVTATDDLESLFQLIHLSMTAPRADESALRRLENRTAPVVDDPATDPSLAAADALLDIRYPDELRYAQLPTPEQFDTLDLDGVLRVWSQRFGNADGWVVVLSGDLDIEVAADLAASYLGTLPAGTPELPVDVEDPPPASAVRAGVTAGSGDTASLTVLYTAPAGDVTPELRATIDVASELIGARLLDVVREELGDSYSPTASTYLDLDPDPAVETYVSVTGSPQRVEQLGELVTGEIADLVVSGPSDQEFGNAVAQVAERYRFVNNWEFVTELLDDALEPAVDLDSYLFREAVLGDVDVASLRAFLGAHVPVDRYIQVTVTPG